MDCDRDRAGRRERLQYLERFRERAHADHFHRFRCDLARGRGLIERREEDIGAVRARRTDLLFDPADVADHRLAVAQQRDRAGPRDDVSAGEILRREGVVDGKRNDHAAGGPDDVLCVDVEGARQTERRLEVDPDESVSLPLHGSRRGRLQPHGSRGPAPHESDRYRATDLVLLQEHDRALGILHLDAVDRDDEVLRAQLSERGQPLNDRQDARAGHGSDVQPERLERGNFRLVLAVVHLQLVLDLDRIVWPPRTACSGIKVTLRSTHASTASQTLTVLIDSDTVVRRSLPLDGYVFAPPRAWIKSSTSTDGPGPTL